MLLSQTSANSIILLYQGTTLPVSVDSNLTLPLYGQVIELVVANVYSYLVYKNFSNPSNALINWFFFNNCLSLSCSAAIEILWDACVIVAEPV